MLRHQIIQDTLLRIPTTASVISNALCLLGLVLCIALAAVGTVYFMGPQCEDKSMLLPQRQKQQTSLLPSTVTPLPTTSIVTACRVEPQQAPTPQASRPASSCNMNLSRSTVAAF